MKHLLLRAGVIFFPVALFVFAVVALGSISQGRAYAVDTCTKNGDCGNTATMFCDKVAKVCKAKNGSGYCKTNKKCAPGQLCNKKSRTCLQNTCQKNSDCRNILNLPSNFTCNKTTHTCQ